MNLAELLKKLMLEGKTNAEIAQAILDQKVAPDMDAKEIAAEIATARKSEEIQAELKKQDEEKAATKSKKESDETLQKKIDDSVSEKLKEINIDPTRKFANSKTLKRFNAKNGKIEEVETSETYSEFNNMLKAFWARDNVSAKSISNAIDIDNFLKDPNNAGKATPSVSDVDSRGGFSIPTEVNDRIMQVLYEVSMLYSRMNKDNIIFESKVYPLMFGINVDYIADQGTTITEKNPTFTNPEVTMHRIGVFSTISNKFLTQKQADLVNVFVQAYGSAFAEFLDLHAAVGNVTGNSDKVDGIVFDPLTDLPSPIALGSLTVGVLKTIKNTLSEKVNLKNVVWVANRKVADEIGLLENTGGNYAFPGYVEGRQVAPFGIPLITDPQIPSTLNIGADNRTSGTDDVLIAVDLSKVVVGVSGETRIDTSDHFLFTDDLMTIRAIKNYGQKVLSGTSTGGVVAVAQELTNV